MKYLFTLFFPLPLHCCLFAQTEFAPVGATWYYTWGGTTGFGYEKMISEKDTIFNETDWKKLTHEVNGYDVITHQFFTITLPPAFVYQDSFRYYFYFNEQTYLLYDFNAQPGDTFTTLYDPFWDLQVNKITVTVDSIGIQNINAVDLKWIKVSSPNYSEWPWSVRIYEKLGSLCYMFALWDSPLNEGYYQLRCYDDSDFGHYETGVASACDEIFSGIAEIENNYFSIAPNPARDIIAVGSDANLFGSEIDIYNVIGSKMKSSTFTNSPTEVSISDLSNGIYFVRVKDGVIRFVKE